MIENIVCVPAGTIHDGLYLNSNSSFNSVLEKIGSARFLAVRDKSSSHSIENNVAIRQLIVYIFVKQGSNLFIYQRNAKTGEGRLAGKYALCGGHCNSLSENFLADIQSDTLRELTEELKFTPKGKYEVFPTDGAQLSMKISGILQSSCDEESNLVQLVHTGIVVRVDIDKDYDIELFEDSMCNLTKINLSNYMQYIDKSEKWLQQLLPFIPEIL